MIGRPVDDVYRQYGLPNITRPLDGAGQEMYWHRADAVRNGQGMVVMRRNCELRVATLPDGRIRDFAFLGGDNECLFLFRETPPGGAR